MIFRSLYWHFLLATFCLIFLTVALIFFSTEENIGTKLNLGLREDFVNLAPKTREAKAKINEWDYIQLKSFCSAAETANKTKATN